MLEERLATLFRSEKCIVELSPTAKIPFMKLYLLLSFKLISAETLGK
jgi:hypothetical protein